MTTTVLLTVKEFASLVRKDPQTIYRRIWRHAQSGVVRDGRTILIDPTKAIVYTSDLTAGPGDDA